MAAVIAIPWVLPQPPEDDPEALTAWYAEHYATIKHIDQAIYRAKRSVKQQYERGGPVPTQYGTVTVKPDGWDWDPAMVMEVMPALIRDAKLQVTGKASQVFRAHEMIEEECPDLSCMTTGIVDAVEANRVLRLKGDGAALLEPCRTPRGKLTVVPD